MVAALIANTNVGATVGAGASAVATGLHEGVYAVTIVTTLDWIVLSDFTEVKYVHAFTEADGVDAEAYIDGTTKNKVFVTGTGATVLLVKGIKA